MFKRLADGSWDSKPPVKQPLDVWHHLVGHKRLAKVFAWCNIREACNKRLWGQLRVDVTDQPCCCWQFSEAQLIKVITAFRGLHLCHTTQQLWQPITWGSSSNSSSSSSSAR
jgi:hypothetical protein